MAECCVKFTVFVAIVVHILFFGIGSLVEGLSLRSCITCGTYGAGQIVAGLVHLILGLILCLGVLKESRNLVRGYFYTSSMFFILELIATVLMVIMATVVTRETQVFIIFVVCFIGMLYGGMLYAVRVYYKNMRRNDSNTEVELADELKK